MTAGLVVVIFAVFRGKIVDAISNRNPYVLAHLG